MHNVHHPKIITADTTTVFGADRRKRCAFLVALFAAFMLVCGSVALAHEQATESLFDEPIEDIPAEIEDQEQDTSDLLIVSQESIADEEQPADEEQLEREVVFSAQETELDDETISAQADKNVTSSTTTWSNGTYTVSGNIEIEKRVTVSGNVVLQLNAGSRLTVLSGINVPSGAALTIQGEGVLFAYAPESNVNHAVIGGNSAKKTGRIIIDSGRIEVNVSSQNFAGAGIGSGNEGEDGEVVINGGIVNVSSMFRDSMKGAAIGGGQYAANISVQILGGTVNAQGSNNAPAIGTGFGFGQANIVISNANVTAVGYGTSPAIGGQQASTPNASSVSIANSTVKATAQGSAPAIGYLGPGTLSIGDSSASSPSTTLVHASSIDPRCMTDTEAWKGIVFTGDDGTVYGESALANDLMLEANQQLTIPGGSTLTIPANITLQDQGSITNEGTVINDGSIVGSGTFVNNGTLIDNGIFFPQEVTFDTQGGSDVPALTVNRDSLITDSIPDPTREGHAFGGWYQDSSTTIPWDFDTDRVTRPLTLYAKWDALEDPSEPSQPETPIDPKPDVPSDPIVPEDPEKPGDPIGEPAEPDGDHADEQLPADEEQEGIDEDTTDEADSVKPDRPHDSVPKLGDPILVLPLFFGVLGILIALNLDTFIRSRKRLRWSRHPKD